METKFEKIDKESVQGLSFPTEEVLDTKEMIVQRKVDLDRALSLGNLEHVKFKIFFEDNLGLKMTETTIWGITEDRVILKQGIVIPVKRIHKVL